MVQPTRGQPWLQILGTVLILGLQGSASLGFFGPELPAHCNWALEAQNWSLIFPIFPLKVKLELDIPYIPFNDKIGALYSIYSLKRQHWSLIFPIFTLKATLEHYIPYIHFKCNIGAFYSLYSL